MNNRRKSGAVLFLLFGSTHSHYVVVEFEEQLNLSEPEQIFIAAEGKYNVKLDGKLQFGIFARKPYCFRLGTYNLNIKVWESVDFPLPST